MMNDEMFVKPYNPLADHRHYSQNHPSSLHFLLQEPLRDLHS